MRKNGNDNDNDDIGDYNNDDNGDDDDENNHVSGRDRWTVIYTIKYSHDTCVGIGAADVVYLRKHVVCAAGC